MEDDWSWRRQEEMKVVDDCSWRREEEEKSSEEWRLSCTPPSLDDHTLSLDSYNWDV